MKTKKEEYLLEWLEDSMLFLIWHSIACLVLGLFYPDSKRIFLSSFLLILLVSSCLIIRAFIQCLSLFLLFHMVVFFLAILWGKNVIEKAAFAVITFIFIVRSIRTRLNKEETTDRGPHVIWCVVFGGISLIAVYLGRESLHVLCYVELMCYCIFYFIKEKKENTMLYLKQNRDLANLPASNIRAISNMTLWLYLVAVILAMLIAPRLHLDSIVKGILYLLLIILKFIFSLIRGKAPTIDFIPESSTYSPGGMPEFDQGTTALWAIFLEKLVMFLTAVAIILGLAALLGYMGYRIYQKFYEKNNNEKDYKEFVRPDFLPERLKRMRYRKENLSDRTINLKIRRIYKGQFIKKRKDKIPSNLTPNELEEWLKVVKNTEINHEITELYEKARYGNQECSKEEWLRMKKLL